MAKRILIAGFVLALLIFAIILPVHAVLIDSTTELGPISHYNALIFDYFETHRASTEGAVAIGGSGRLGTGGQYDFGASSAPNYATVSVGQYENQKGYPTLLLNAQPQVGGVTGRNVHAYGGPVVLPETLRDGYDESIVGTTKYLSASAVDRFFAEAYQAVTDVSQTLLAANTKENAVLPLSELTHWQASSRFSDLTAFEPDNLATGTNNLSAGNVLVIQVSSGSYAEINAPQITSAFGAYEVIVFNFPDATSVNLRGGSVFVDGAQLNPTAPAYWYPAQNALLKQYAERIIWNFPQAKTVQVTNCGVVGSVLAPNAYVEANGGSVNGMLVCDAFVAENGNTIHGFPIPEAIFSFKNENEAPLYGAVQLLKLDAETERVLPGAVYKLERQEEAGWQAYGESSYQTDTYGKLKLKDLPEGAYRLTEIEAPDGYVLPAGTDGIVSFRIDAEHGVDSVLQLTHTNQKRRTDLAFRKTTESGEGLAGAAFMAYMQRDSEIVLLGTIYSGSDGTVQLKQLAAGRYFLVEVDAPDGYEIHPDYEFLRIDIGYVQEAGALSIVYQSLQNPMVSGTVSETSIPELPNLTEETPHSRVVLTKLSEEGQIAITGASFDLEVFTDGEWIQPEGFEGPFVTDEYGHVVLEYLPAGMYRFAERSAPDGYEMLSAYSEPFSIGDGMLEHEITMKNRAKRGSLEVVKQDAQGTGLSGAYFDLYRAAGGKELQYITQLETDFDGTASLDELEQGVYWLEAVVAPPGYELPEEPLVRFLVGEEETAELPSGYEHRIEFVSEPEQQGTGSATFLKADAEDTGIRLEGVVSDLYVMDPIDRHFMKVDRYETDETGTLSLTELPYGLYKLEEISNPHEDYEIVTAHDEHELLFSITSNAPDLEPIFVLNQKKSSAPDIDIKLLKLDAETKAPLSGAKFHLLQQESGGAWNLLHANIVTDAEGTVTTDHLRAGTYLLREVQVPAGYQIIASEEPLEVQFTINETEDTLEITDVIYSDTANDVVSFSADRTEITVYNSEQPQFPELAIYKVDADVQEQALPGAEFALYRSLSGTDTDYQLYSIVSSNAEGRLVNPVLTAGRYLLVEKTAPPGFVNQGQQFSFDVKETANGLKAYYEGREITQETQERFVIPNQRKTAELTLYKRNKQQPETGLEGAAFHLQYMETAQGDYRTIATVISEEDGAIILSGLHAGYYRLLETQPPQGFESNDTAYLFEVQEIDGIFLFYQDGVSLTDGMKQIFNDPTEAGTEPPPTTAGTTSEPATTGPAEPTTAPSTTQRPTAGTQSQTRTTAPQATEETISREQTGTQTTNPSDSTSSEPGQLTQGTTAWSTTQPAKVPAPEETGTVKEPQNLQRKPWVGLYLLIVCVAAIALVVFKKTFGTE